MADNDQHEMKIKHLAWAISHHAQLHQGETKEPWLWPSRRNGAASTNGHAPVDARMNQLEKESKILCCVRSLMAANKNDVSLLEEESLLLTEEEKQKHEIINTRSNHIKHVEGLSAQEMPMMLETTLDIINQAVELAAERSKAGGRIGSAARVVRAYRNCLQDLVLTDERVEIVRAANLSKLEVNH